MQHFGRSKPQTRAPWTSSAPHWRFRCARLQRAPQPRFEVVHVAGENGACEACAPFPPRQKTNVWGLRFSTPTSSMYPSSVTLSSSMHGVREGLELKVYCIARSCNACQCSGALPSKARRKTVSFSKVARRLLMICRKLGRCRRRVRAGCACAAARLDERLLEY